MGYKITIIVLSIAVVIGVFFAVKSYNTPVSQDMTVATGEICDPPVAEAAAESAAEDAPKAVDAPAKKPVEAPAEKPVKAPVKEPADNKESATESSSSSEQKNLPKLVDFGSTTCLPCKQMMPILGELAEENKGKLVVEFVNVNEDRARAQKEGIRLIPLQVFYDKNGKELYRHEGFYPMAGILAKWKELGYTFKSKTAN